jgi:PKD repeat protein
MTFASCATQTSPAPDSGSDAPPDAGVDGMAAALLSVDFTVVGCPRADFQKPQCHGTAPLTISFAPITSSAVTRLFWDFGDLSKSSERAPTHTYSLPGTYTVTLTGVGATGPVSQTHVEFVVVTPNELGEPCDVDAQCVSGLTCFCGSAARCPRAFPRGMCTSACSGSVCGAGAVCADLSRGALASSMEPWRVPLCLKPCQNDADCPAGHLCRSIPAPNEGGDWVRACFVDFPADFGAPCRGGNDRLQDDLCLTGTCSDLGALGLCSLECPTDRCPNGTTCATFGDGRHLCLRRCDPDFACAEDPLLSCVPPGRTGALGFSVTAAPAEATFCAPKPCDRDTDCPSGVCQDDPQMSHCVRRMTSP